MIFGQRKIFVINNKMSGVATQILKEVQSNSLNAVVGGFAFASAIAWLDVVRWLVSSFIDMPKTSGPYFIVSALLTTLVSVIVYMIISRWIKDIKKPSVVYGVTGTA